MLEHNMCLEVHLSQDQLRRPDDEANQVVGSRAVPSNGQGTNHAFNKTNQARFSNIVYNID